MSITYCLFDKQTRRCINFGRKVDTPFGYQGPTVYISGQRARLPDDLLVLLKQRFIEAHGDKNVAFIADWELFDSGDYLQPDEETVQVGGDEDNAIPLSLYLHELKQPDALHKAA